jgi:hypothetical protein
MESILPCAMRTLNRQASGKHASRFCFDGGEWHWRLPECPGLSGAFWGAGRHNDLLLTPKPGEGIRCCASRWVFRSGGRRSRLVMEEGLEHLHDDGLFALGEFG